MKESNGVGIATILAIGTAFPPNCIDQEDYPDFYFQITQSQHLTELKAKFKRICERSTVRKRYIHLTKETIKKYPNIGIFSAPSLDARQDILIPEVPKLGMEAALKAIEEWGNPISKITHLIFCTTSGINIPGADFELMKLLGLPDSVQRFMIYQQGCFAGGTTLRLAKDIAENNPNSRVLIVCSENTIISFQAPSASHLDTLVSSALFGDGAAAIIVGANPDSTERSLFQLISTSQTTIPNSGNEIIGRTLEIGISYQINKSVPMLIEDRVVEIMSKTFNGIEVEDWNSLFYVVHPGGPSILNGVEEKLGLEKEKLRTSRSCLSEYGNVWSVSVFLVLDEMRKSSKLAGKKTTGEGLDFGVLLSFGPGLTVESVVLKSVPISCL